MFDRPACKRLFVVVEMRRQRCCLLGALALYWGAAGAAEDLAPRLDYQLQPSPILGRAPAALSEMADAADDPTHDLPMRLALEWEPPQGRGQVWPPDEVPAAEGGGSGGRVDQSQRPPAASAAPSSRQWGMAPLQWRGTVGNYYNFSESGNSRSSSIQDRIDLNGRSYILSPAFLPISGTVSGSRSSNTTSDGGDAKSLGGALGLNATYLPFSRAPLVGDYSFSRSAFGGGDPVTTQSFGVAQSYSEPSHTAWLPAGSYNYQARRNVNSTGAAENSTDAINGGLSTDYRGWGVSANGGAQRQTTAGQAEPFTINLSGSGRRSYTFEDYDATLSSTLGANYFTAESRSGILFNGNSAADWYPDVDSPLQLNFHSQANYAQLKDQQLVSRFGSLTADVGARYPASKNLTYNGSTSWAGFWDPSGAFAQSLAANVGATYSGDSRNIYGFTYNWGASAGVGANILNSTGAGQSLTTTASANHGISRSFNYGSQLDGSVSASQGVSASLGGELGQRFTLNSSADTGWVYTPFDGASVRANLRYGNDWSNDRLSPGQSAMTQSLNGSIAGTYQYRHQLSGYRSLSANASLTTVAAWSSRQTGTVLTWGGLGTVNYVDTRFLGRPALNYTAGYSLFVSPRLGNDVGATGSLQLSHNFTQTLSYTIGRLSFNASNSFVQVGGINSATIFFSIQRQIGQ